jgi:KUP system potassium uptake protein
MSATGADHQPAHPGRAAIIVAALGVVFGDIGTSPIYTLQTVFSPDDPHPVAVSHDSVLGVTSLIFWSVMVIVTVTYVLLVMRADNDGEGGIMALTTLVRRLPHAHRRTTTLVLAALGIFGASLFFGDSMITPAISVLSAVEGLRIAAPSLEHLIVPITAVIIVVLFLTQRLGTAVVGRMFGPVMIVWFTAIAIAGVRGITLEPEILKALSPTYALGFFFGHFGIAFFALAAIVLAVTGAEALYADMGHFGRSPIRLAWLGLVFPACTLSYLGQGALILDDPANISGPFFLLVPDWAQVPLVLLATAATVIASQAVITGAFSVAHQAVQLGYLPRLRIVHTSPHAVGQIYVPWINWLLMLSVLTLIFTFETSAALAFAFGMAVTGTITITTLIYFFLLRERWGRPLWLVAGGAALLLTVDALFLAANLTKLLHGAWLPLAIGVTAFTVLTTWQRGRALVTAQRAADEGPLRAFLDEVHAGGVTRVPGTAVFLNRGKETAPLAMRASVEHLHALAEHVVILSLETTTVPHVPPAERVTVDGLGYTDDGITHITARFGYTDATDVPATLALVDPAQVECRLEVQDATYFLSTVELRHGREHRMTKWRTRLFLATSRITADAAEYFNLPRERTVILGSRIEV